MFQLSSRGRAPWRNRFTGLMLLCLALTLGWSSPASARTKVAKDLQDTVSAGTTTGRTWINTVGGVTYVSSSACL
jgi:hypothetical protein